MTNKIQLIGHLGAAPEAKTTPNGSKYVRLRVATHEVYYNKKGERVDETTWHNVVAWDRQADLAVQRLNKGSEVLIAGRLSNRQWEDQNGKKQYMTEVVALGILVMDRKAASVA